MKLDTAKYEEKMKKTVASFEETLSTIRAGQASSAVLNGISFEYYGAMTPLNTMADIKVTDSKTLVIVPYDKTTFKPIEKAILASNVGITPTNDGSCIRLVFPQLSEERRKELTKQVQKYGEEAKVAIRNIRRDANEDSKKQKKDGTMTEDEQKASDKSIQDLTDKYIKNIDDISAKKNAEIMKI
ncbi:MAG: ribosome recycling factor [Clostridia bacterium]|nr:ribosome recycling factor [Clostridia bacterium]